MMPPPIPNKFAVNPAKMKSGIAFLKLILYSSLFKENSIWLTSCLVVLFFALVALYIILLPAISKVTANRTFNIKLSILITENRIVAKTLPNIEKALKNNESLKLVLFCRK